MADYSIVVHAIVPVSVYCGICCPVARWLVFRVFVARLVSYAWSWFLISCGIGQGGTGTKERANGRIDVLSYKRFGTCKRMFSPRIWPNQHQDFVLPPFLRRQNIDDLAQRSHETNVPMLALSGELDGCILTEFFEGVCDSVGQGTYSFSKKYHCTDLS